MKYSQEDFLGALNLDTVHEAFFDFYEESMSEYESRGVFFLDDEFIESILAKYRFLTEKYDFVVRERSRVRESELCAKYSFLLYKMLVRNHGKAKIRLTNIPKPDDIALRVDFEMAAYFATLAFAPDMIDYYEKRGLPCQIITDTLQDCFEDTIKLRTVTHDRDGFDDNTYFYWNQLYTNYSIIRVGVLNFEIDAIFNRKVKIFENGNGDYRIFPLESPISQGGYIAGTAGHTDEKFTADIEESETEYIGYSVDTDKAIVTEKREALAKSEWRIALSPGDRIISVHIPTGTSLTKENCIASYRDALVTVRNFFPEYNVKAIYCCTWLLDPQHAEMLSEKSNIVNFGRQYKRFPVLSQGKGVFSFLFRRPYKSLDELPENTTLERRVKAHYISGNFIYEAGGVIFEQDIK